MNKCDPFYCEGLTRGHTFWCHTFLSKKVGGGSGRGQVGVGEGVVGLVWVWMV